MVATRAVSPDAIRSSAKGKHMRRSSMSQETAVYERPLLSWVLDHNQLVAGIAITSLVVIGTGTAAFFDLAYDTSNPFAQPPHTAFLRSKENIINQLFVKRAWGWTLSCVLSQLAVSPSSVARPSIRHRVAALAVATALWYGFTAWFFGAGIGDRIISATGGVCAIPLPAGLDQSSHDAFLAAAGSPAARGQIPSGFVPVAPSFCNSRTPFTPESHPMLFSPADSSQLQKLTARWTRGVDISGHIWLLTLASMRLASEVSEGLRVLVFSQSKINRPLTSTATWYSAFFLAMWLFMIFITSIFFHRETEKLVALVLGLCAGWFVDRAAALVDSSTEDVTIGIDENAARRLQDATH